MKNKKLAVIICMLVTASVFPIVTSSLASDGNIIYVDDDAPPEWYDAGSLSIVIMHPGEKCIYLGWMSTYLGGIYPDMDYTIILGKNIYNLFYGFQIISDSNLSYIEIYVNEELEMTLYEPTDYDGFCQEWQVHWCPCGYNEIRLMAIDQYNNRFNAYRNLLVI